MNRSIAASAVAAGALFLVAIAPIVARGATIDPATNDGAPVMFDRFAADAFAGPPDFAFDPRSESAVEPDAPAPTLEVIGDAASDGPFDVAYTLPGAEPFALGVYDATGRLVVELDDGMGMPGEHLASWDPSDTGEPAGVYFVVLTAGDARRTVRVARTP